MRDDSETIEFQVAGELKTDPGHLLLLGDDGRWYDYDVACGTIAAIVPGDSWAVDAIHRVALRPEAPKSLPAPGPVLGDAGLPRFDDASVRLKVRRTALDAARAEAIRIFGSALHLPVRLRAVAERQHDAGERAGGEADAMQVRGHDQTNAAEQSDRAGAASLGR